MICIYHRSDFDGKCSAAIVKYKHPECTLYGMDYGDTFDWDSITIGEEVYMVDFSLPPLEMQELDERAYIRWIDHHKTAIEKMSDLWIRGLQHDGIGACALTWSYLFPDQPMPYAVKLLAEHDVWNHSDPNTLPFQYGLRTRDAEPADEIWTKLFTGNSDIIVEEIIKTGHIIMNYEQRSNALYAKATAFEMVWEDLKCIAINRPLAGSALFDDVFRPSEHDMMVSFGWVDGQWKVSLRSTGRDVSEIARKYGGGGHATACGFTCKKLPFKLEVR